MNRRRIAACGLLLLVLGGDSARAEEPDPPTARDVMRQVELNQRVSAEALVFEMVLTDRSGFQRRRRVREFRRREPGDLESSLVFFDDPPDIRGSALLSKERSDGRDDQWLYLPAVGKIRRIAESGRTDYFLGTDLTFEDFSVEDIEQFTYRFSAPDTVIAGRLARVIDAVAADSTAQRRSGYSLRRIYVDAGRSVILRTDYFDRSGKWIKVLHASDLVSYEMPSRRPGALWRANQVFVDNFRRNHKTLLRVTARDLSVNFPPDLFTPRTLQRGSIPEIFSRPSQTSLGNR